MIKLVCTFILGAVCMAAMPRANNQQMGVKPVITPRDNSPAYYDDMPMFWHPKQATQLIRKDC